MIEIKKLILSDFRNFSSKKIELYRPMILLVGANGAGKTNILESLTMLGRNASLRGSEFDEIIAKDKKNFSIFAEVLEHEFIEKIGISFDGEKKKRDFQINGEALNSKRQGDVKTHLPNFIFLTPQLEQLFVLGKSERRDYLDKIVSDIDDKHPSRISSYQKLLKERLLVLQQKESSEKWLDAIETQIVEFGVAIASARVEAIGFFNKAISSFSSNFPKTELRVIGEIEQSLQNQSAVQLECRYGNCLKENRQIDRQNFKTEFGVHRCDFDALFSDKKISALHSSTGEQKAVMISITLARAKISSAYKNQPTILIFDEVASHLDEARKAELFEEIKSMYLQSFFSATNKDLIPQHFLDEIQIITL